MPLLHIKLGEGLNFSALTLRGGGAKFWCVRIEGVAKGGYRFQIPKFKAARFPTSNLRFKIPNFKITDSRFPILKISDSQIQALIQDSQFQKGLIQDSQFQKGLIQDSQITPLPPIDALFTTTFPYTLQPR